MTSQTSTLAPARRTTARYTAAAAALLGLAALAQAASTTQHLFEFAGNGGFGMNDAWSTNRVLIETAATIAAVVGNQLALVRRWRGATVAACAALIAWVGVMANALVSQVQPDLGYSLGQAVRNVSGLADQIVPAPLGMSVSGVLIVAALVLLRVGRPRSTDGIPSLVRAAGARGDAATSALPSDQLDTGSQRSVHSSSVRLVPAADSA